MMVRKSLSTAASAALSYLSTFNERYFSLRDKNVAAATSLKEDMRGIYDKQIWPCLEPHFQDNDTVRRVVETYKKLVKV